MAIATFHAYTVPQNGFRPSFSFSAAFTSVSLVHPPPMTSHMFDHTSRVGTLFSTFDNQTYESNTGLFFSKFMNSHSDRAAKIIRTEVNGVYPPRIAIIGGGIAGVTAASALAKHLGNENKPAKIVLFEQDSEGAQRNVAFDECKQPIWTAATARNANSMVPGAAMHIMSQRSTLKQIFVDTCQETITQVLEKIRPNPNPFNSKPPYFALHLYRCIGPSASWDERMTFLEFMRHFLVISLFSGEKEAHARGSLIQQLAKSNRLLFLESLEQIGTGTDLHEKIGTNKGFLSLHRTRQAALHAEQEGKEYNEDSEMIPIDHAIELEPRISKLPIQKLFAVHRKDDYTANSALFVQELVKSIKALGIEYKCGTKGMIQGIVTQDNNKASVDKDSAVLATSARDCRFKITTEDGTLHKFDYVILASGVNTPLLAKKIEVEKSSSFFKPSICPTYPLRGYSLTIYTDHTKQDAVERKKKGISANLLNKPISIDDMYCSSVGLNMARMAGFGELVGYREKAKDIPSLAPQVMARYCRTIFPESDVKEDHALQCFRPITPDDLPLVGEDCSVPGLYLHTGHGTLGWTMCLATAECIAQAICNSMAGRNTDTYQLPGGVQMRSASLSPNRF